MKVIKPSFEFEPINREQILKNIERAGRTCLQLLPELFEDLKIGY